MQETNHSPEDSIDILALAGQLWQARKMIIKSVVMAGLVGVIVALATPNQYQASSMFVPNYGKDSPGGASGLKGLASLAGIDLGSMGSGSSELSPMLYGKIIESPVFKSALLEAPLLNTADSPSVRDYLLKGDDSFLSLIKGYTIGLPGKLWSWLKTGDSDQTPGMALDGVVAVSDQDYGLFKALDEMLQISINDKDGYIELSATTGDPGVSAQLAKRAEQLLQDEIISLKTKGSLELLDYLQQQYDDKRALQTRAQQELSRFKDQNMNISSYSFSNTQTRLESELATATSVFQGVSAQYEQTKLQVAKDTPVFSILKPVALPNERSAPKRSLIVAVWLFLGLVGSAGYVLAKEPVKEALKAVKNKQS